MFFKIKEILHFWFGEDKSNLLLYSHRWFLASPDFDQAIRAAFSDIHASGCKGEIYYWVEQPQSCLAYIILFDQFSRNIFRGTPKAYLQDTLALNALLHAREHKLDKELSIIQRFFCYMPLQHSEELSHQKLSLALLKQLIDETKENKIELLKTIKNAYGYAQKHYDIILNFGRFPQRNLILGRENTQAEQVFLSFPHNYF